MRSTGSSVTLGLLALVIATCVAYAPAIRAPFLFDDVIIGENPTIRHLHPLSVVLAPPPQTPVAGRPVVNYSLALNYALNARLGIYQSPDLHAPDATLGYHVVNLLLHIACGLLLFGLLRRTVGQQRFSERWAAWASPVSLAITGAWLLHPIQTEAINYVIQRTEVIVSLFYVGTLYASLRAWDASSRRARQGWYAIAIGACLLGMGSKEVMISAPFAVMLYDRAFRWRTWGEILRGGRAFFYLCLVATTAVLITLMVTGPRSATVGFHLGLTWEQYFYTQCWAILHYVRLVLWPNRLTLDYGLNPVRGLRGIPGLVILAAFGVATVFAWTRVERWGWFAFLGTWFFMILAPSSSFVPINTEVAAERRIYLALVPVLILIVAGVDALAARLARRQPVAGRRSRPSVDGHWRWVATAIIVALGIVTFNRSLLYADDVAMWRDVVAKVPSNPRGYENLAAVLAEQSPNDLGEAEDVLRRGIAADSTYPPNWDKLAAMEISQHRLQEARSDLDRAIAADPRYERSLRRMGTLLADMGQPDSGAVYLERAVASEPKSQVYADLAAVDVAARRPDKAIDALTHGLALDSTRVDLLQYLGALLTETGRTTEAIAALQRAVDRDPSSGVSDGLLSLAYAMGGLTQNAIIAARSAVSNANANGGSDSRPYLFAARALLHVNDAADAQQILEQAVQRTPSDSEAVTLLADARAAAKAARKRAP